MINKNSLKSPIYAIGLSTLLILILYFVYAFYSVIPEESDLNPVEQVRVPVIDSPSLEDQLQGLKKVDGLPLIVDPSQLGKEDPYK